MIKNKYYIWYFNLIEKAKKRNNLQEYETHHIIPRFAGGLDDDNNLVRLSYREHYICHKILTKLYAGPLKAKAFLSLHRMCFAKKYGSPSKLYEQFRKEFIKHLKEYHPSRLNPESWSQTCKINAKKQWQNNEERRKNFSDKMKSLWKEGKITPEMSRKNGKHNKFGILNHKTIEIEYKGKIYYGYRELEEATGVTGYLYIKYYKHGIDPESRIGKNGPVPK